MKAYFVISDDNYEKESVCVREREREREREMSVYSRLLDLFSMNSETKFHNDPR